MQRNGKEFDYAVLTEFGLTVICDTQILMRFYCMYVCALIVLYVLGVKYKVVVWRFLGLLVEWL